MNPTIKILHDALEHVCELLVNCSCQEDAEVKRMALLDAYDALALVDRADSRRAICEGDCCKFVKS